MRFYITSVSLCLLVVGCTPNTSGEIASLRSEVVDLQSEVDTLKIQVAQLNQEVEKQTSQMETIPNVAPVSDET